VVVVVLCVTAFGCSTAQVGLGEMTNPTAQQVGWCCYGEGKGGASGGVVVVLCVTAFDGFVL
jgi:hypothetical protein